MLDDRIHAMPYKAIFEFKKQTLFSHQIPFIVIAWIFMCWLHWNNNGLWYGDAPVHAANGLFWKDFLLSFSVNPKNYALSYYARYPVIAPTKYPPIFYLLEAVFFGIFGPSPYIAKGLVLGFTLMAALYISIWCRRWIAEEAGWAGMLLILLPGVIRWSHAIMLNIPALALSIGALYHFRRWMESPPVSPAWKHLYAGAAMAVLSILTYLTSCVLLLIAGIWFIIEHRWRLLWYRKTLLVFIASVLVLLPWALLLMKFEQNRMEMATGRAHYLTSTTYWRWALSYYPKQLPGLFGTHLLIIAISGIIGGLIIRRWRHETIFLLISAVVCFTFFSYIPARESRYILLLSLPIVNCCFICLQVMIYFLRKVTNMTLARTRIVNLAVLAVLISTQAWLASNVYVMSVSGYEDLTEFLKKNAPEEPIFYDGKHYANFTFQVQAKDPNYQRRVVLGRKILYSEEIYGDLKDFVSSPKDIIEVFQKRGGCRWIAVADRPDNLRVKATSYLRRAVKGPEFKLVKSFPITRRLMNGTERTNINLYQFLVPIEPINEIEIPFYSLREIVHLRIKPIQR